MFRLPNSIIMIAVFRFDPVAVTPLILCDVYLKYLSATTVGLLYVFQLPYFAYSSVELNPND